MDRDDVGMPELRCEFNLSNEAFLGENLDRDVPIGQLLAGQRITLRERRLEATKLGRQNTRWKRGGGAASCPARNVHDGARVRQ
jgi:hypothetical protein